VDNTIFYDKIKNSTFKDKVPNSGELYNCLYDVMPDDLKEIREYLLKYKNLNHSLSGISHTYFIASKERNVDNNFIIQLNKNFPKYKILLRKRMPEYKYFRMYR
jgi:hypothetical protein